MDAEQPANFKINIAFLTLIDSNRSVKITLAPISCV